MLDVKRVEKKYLTDPVGMVDISGRLKHLLQDDPHNGDSGYMIRSLYFDSVTDMDYYAKTDGIDVRKKIRLRLYDTSDEIIKLEVKEKAGGMQRKRSLNISRNDAEEIMQGNYESILKYGNDFSKALYLLMTKELYRPKCIVEYDRYAYVHSENNIRVTFDSNLRGSSICDRFFDKETVFTPITGNSEITLEVKYDGFLYSGIKSAIGDHLTLEISNSKYCRAREVFI
jgi:hypothetical protein